MMCCNNCGWLRWVTTTNTTYYCEFDGHPLSDLKDCCQAWKSTIQTNADRIRSMTDEELLEFLYWEADGSGKTPEQWISWLKQEVKQ